MTDQDSDDAADPTKKKSRTERMKTFIRRCYACWEELSLLDQKLTIENGDVDVFFFMYSTVARWYPSNENVTQWNRQHAAISVGGHK